MTIHIILNGRKVELDCKEGPNGEKFVTLSYEEIATKAEEHHPTITFRCNVNRHIQGELLPGQSMIVVDGMIINAINTGNA